MDKFKEQLSPISSIMCPINPLFGDLITCDPDPQSMSWMVSDSIIHADWCCENELNLKDNKVLLSVTLGRLRCRKTRRFAFPA